MAAQRQVPGGAYVNEVDTAQRQIPGWQYINETIAAPVVPPVTPSTPYPGPAGKARSTRARRKKYQIDGQTLALTRDELEDALEALLTRPVAEDVPVQPARVKAKDAAIVAAFPAYPDIRDMLLAAQQIEAAQALRAVAQRLADDEDERDVEMLLLWG